MSHKIGALAEADLVRRAQAGDQEAKAALLTGHVAFIHQQVSRRRRLAPAAPRDDLVQAGLLGALMALRRFQPCYDCRFLTFAGRWIKTAIAREAARHLLVSLPERADPVGDVRALAALRPVEFFGDRPSVAVSRHLVVARGEDREYDVEDVEDLRLAVVSLPPEEQAVVCACCLRGESLGQAARVTGLSLWQVQQRLAAALPRLRRRILSRRVEEMLRRRREARGGIDDTE